MLQNMLDGILWLQTKEWPLFDHSVCYVPSFELGRTTRRDVSDQPDTHGTATCAEGKYSPGKRRQNAMCLRF